MRFFSILFFMFLAAQPGRAAQADLFLSAQIVRFPEDTPPGAFFNTLRRSGVEEVIVRVFSNPGDRPLAKGSKTGWGVLFPTRSAPVIDPLWPQLKAAAVEEGVRLIPWMATRSLPPFTKEDEPEFIFKPGRGLTASENRSFFSPIVWQGMVDLFEDLASQGGDRIVLQDDWSWRWNEPLSANARQAYYQDTGQRADPDLFFPNASPPHWGAFLGRPDDFGPLFSWMSWKGKTLAAILGRLQNRLRENHPDLVLIPSLPYELPAQPLRALAWYGLNLPDLKQAGILEAAVMVYHRQIMDETGLDFGSLGPYLRSMADGLVSIGYTGEGTMIKLQGSDWKTGQIIPPEELAAVMAPFREAGFSRFVILLNGSLYPFERLRPSVRP